MTTRPRRRNKELPPPPEGVRRLEVMVSYVEGEAPASCWNGWAGNPGSKCSPFTVDEIPGLDLEAHIRKTLTDYIEAEWCDAGGRPEPMPYKGGTLWAMPRAFTDLQLMWVRDVTDPDDERDVTGERAWFG